MKHRSLLAATLGCVLISSSAFAGFTVTYAPSAQPATGPGLAAYDIFAQNDPDPADGVNLAGVSFTATALGQSKLMLSAFDDGTGFLADQWNFGSGAQQNTIVDVNASNFRIGTRTGAQHAFVDWTGDGTPYLTADQAANGVSSFSADYAVLSSSISVPASASPGARFARIVLKSGPNAGPESPTFPSFTLSGYFGGEVGSKSFATMGFGPGPVPPVVVPGATANVVFGQIVSNGAPFSVVVNVTDANIGQQISLTIATVAGLSNVSVTPTVDLSPASFTITGLVDSSRIGQTVVVPVTANDGTFTSTGSFSLIVTPEPTTALGALALCGLLRRRRA